MTSKINVEGETIFLKKDFLGWRVVEPIKNEDGKINWFNLLFGGKRGLIELLFIFLILGCLYFGINELLGVYKEIAMNPCLYCGDCLKNYVDPIINFNP